MQKKSSSAMTGVDLLLAKKPLPRAEKIKLVADLVLTNAGFFLDLAVSIDTVGTPELDQVLQWQGGGGQLLSLAQLCRKIQDFLQDIAFEMFADNQLDDILQKETGSCFGCDWQIGLLLCSDGRMALWNREFRGKDYPTDILSFPSEKMNFLAEGQKSASCGGDLLLSLRSWQANCQEFACRPEEELQRLLIHGLLHLAGLDHGDEKLLKPQSLMLQYQESLLKSSRQRRTILA